MKNLTNPASKSVSEVEKLRKRSMHDKKSQTSEWAAVTFAWFALIAVVVIVALVYFDILKPERLASKQCNIGPDFECGVEVSNSRVMLTLLNKIDNNITVERLSIAACAGENRGQIEVGQKKTFVIEDCNLGAKGDTFSSETTILYTAADLDFYYNTTGRVTAKVK